MSARRWRGRSGRASAWLGIVALLGGFTLIRLYFDHPNLSRNSNPLVPIIYIGAGGILIFWGLRVLTGEVLRLFVGHRQGAVQRYRVHMPREALVYMSILAVLCVGALVGHSNMLMLVFGLMAGPFVLNGQATLAILKRLSVKRALPEHATVGENFTVKLGLQNDKRLLSAWMVTAEDVVQTSEEQLQPAILFTCVPPRSGREAAYEVRPAHRGLYEFGPVRVMSRFPLGLMERSFELGRVEELIVYPRIGSLKARWRHSVESGELHSAPEHARVGVTDDEFHRLREYRSGDNPRAIHWRTTARRNELTVREYQQSRQQDLLLVVDLFISPRPQPVELERVELAVSFAASVCVDQMQNATDSEIELVLCGPANNGAVFAAGALSISGLLERLALAQSGPAPDLAWALGRASQSADPQVRRVLVTTRARGEVASLLSAEAGPGKLETGKSETGKSETAAAAQFEIIEARPAELAELIEYDERRR